MPPGFTTKILPILVGGQIAQRYVRREIRLLDFSEFESFPVRDKGGNCLGRRLTSDDAFRQKELL